MKVSLTFITSLFFLVGCSGSDNVDGLDFVESEEARIAFSESSVECEDIDDCPSFSGGLFSYQDVTTTNDWGVSEQGFRIGLCSHQLIAPDKILTNRHCLPSNIAYKGASCTGDIYVKFPKTADYEAEAVHCAKVIDLSPNYSGDNVAQLDWAILELKTPVNRPVAKLNKEGVDTDSLVRAYPVYFTSSSVYRDGANHAVAYGKIKKNECTSTTSTIMGVYHHKESPIFVANNCSEKIISGNSGSGLLNEKNELIGVVSFGLSEDFYKVEYSEDKSPVFLRQTLAGGTNLHCIDPLNSEQSSMCYYEEESHEDLMGLAVGAHALKSFGDNFVELRKGIEEENLSKVYLGYADASYEFYDLYIFSNSSLSSLPKDLVRESLYEGVGAVLPNIPSCVSDQAPEYFEEKLAFMDSTRDSNYTINSDAEVVYDPDAMKKSHYLLSYSKEGLFYKLGFVRVPASTIREMKEKKEELSSLQKSCEGIYVSQFFCSRLKTKKNEYNQWVSGLSLAPEVLKNEELLKGRSGDFTMTLPLCSE